MTEKEIVAILGKDRIIAGHHLVCPNVSHVLQGQQDMISVTGRDILIEYEVKISRSDFKRDARKGKQHAIDNVDIYCEKLPNKFFYVTPANLVKVEEVPEWAGLIWIDPMPLNKDAKLVMVKKEAPVIHQFKHDMKKLMKKVATLYQQRFFLGCTLLTYENRAIDARNKARQEEYDLNFKALDQLIANYKKKKGIQ